MWSSSCPPLTPFTALIFKDNWMGCAALPPSLPTMNHVLDTGGDVQSACLMAKFGHEIEIIVPPPKNAVDGNNSQRNRHIVHIAQQGRMNWQKEKGLQSKITNRGTDRTMEDDYRRKPASTKNRQSNHRDALCHKGIEPHDRAWKSALRTCDMNRWERANFA